MFDSQKEIRNSEENEEFLQLLNEIQSEKNAVSSTCFLLKDSSESPPSLLKILPLNEKLLSTYAVKTIDYLEKERTEEDTLIKYSDFKWSVLAFFTIQDIFEAFLFEESALKNMFHQWYFYYESKYLFVELILCWLNGFYKAESSLLRSFTEFNLLQLYFYRITKGTQSYKTLNQYFDKRIAPGWGTLLTKSLPKDDFCKPIRMRLKSTLDGLSQNSVHPYHPSFSNKQDGNMTPGPCFEGVYSWVNIHLVLQPVLWAYYVNFPMLFVPVDLLRKFGFSGPVGLFLDRSQHIAIKNSLSDESYQEFENYANNQENVKNLLSWFNSHNDLTDVQILDSWEDEKVTKPENIVLGNCMKISKLRSMREMMSLEKYEETKTYEQVKNIIKNIKCYSEWKNFINKSANRKIRS